MILIDSISRWTIYGGDNNLNGVIFIILSFYSKVFDWIST